MLQEIPTVGNETFVITVPDSGELTELRNKVRELEMTCKDLEKKNTVQKSLIEFLQTKVAIFIFFFSLSVLKKKWSYCDW